jgi:hypothetical protein
MRRLSQTQEEKQKEKKTKTKTKTKYLLSFSYLQVLSKIIVKIDPKMYLFQMMMRMLKGDESIVTALVDEENSLNYQ